MQDDFCPLLANVQYFKGPLVTRTSVPRGKVPLQQNCNEHFAVQLADAVMVDKTEECLEILEFY